jgi:hypothetical protein
MDTIFCGTEQHKLNNREVGMVSKNASSRHASKGTNTTRQLSLFVQSATKSYL